MKYDKIGTFIMNERKEKKMTQAKLAEKLFVSEKTVSKWENGRGIPDTNTLPKLCEIFDVSLNELLNGERIEKEKYVEKAEEKLMELQASKIRSDKRLLFTEIVVGIIGVFAFFVLLLSAAFLLKQDSTQIALPIIMIVSGVLILGVDCWICLFIEQKAGYYVCEKCNHKHIPTFGQVFIAPHIGRTRYMKCPNCQKKSWQKKILK